MIAAICPVIRPIALALMLVPIQIFSVSYRVNDAAVARKHLKEIPTSTDLFMIASVSPRAGSTGSVSITSVSIPVQIARIGHSVDNSAGRCENLFEIPTIADLL